MRHGLIAKLRITPANVLDHQVVTSVLPDSGMVFCDKLYDTSQAHQLLKAGGIADAIILKNNRANKIRELDRWRSSIRMPFEGVFSKRSKRARYRGVAKVTAQAFLEAISHNLKKAVRLIPEPVVVSG